MTPRQREVMDFIADYMARHRVAPSYDEICAGIGLVSRSGVSRFVDLLVRDGYLRRARDRGQNVRGLQLLRLPDEASGGRDDAQLRAALNWAAEVIRGAGLWGPDCDAVIGEALSAAAAEARADQPAAARP